MANLTITARGLGPDTEVVITGLSTPVTLHNYYNQPGGSQLSQTVFVSDGSTFTVTAGPNPVAIDRWEAGTGATLVSSSGRSGTFTLTATTATIYLVFSGI